MTLEHPVVHRYLEALRRGLDGLPAAERDEIVAEIREHVAQGLASGRQVDDVIASLGPADRLARAYALEAALIEMDPLIAVTIGPAIALAGVGSLVVLWLYARFLIRVVRRAARP